MSGLQRLCIGSVLRKRMRRLVHGMCLLGVAIAVVGCGAARSPQVVIAPSYSYVQADLAAGVTDHNPGTVTQPTTSLSIASSKLPPIPAAPGFDTYVLVPGETFSE